MIMAMVNGVPSKSNPTKVAQTAPQAICMDPNMADAVPAPWWKGRKASVATLGKLNP